MNKEYLLGKQNDTDFHYLGICPHLLSVKWDTFDDQVAIVKPENCNVFNVPVDKLQDVSLAGSVLNPHKKSPFVVSKLLVFSYLVGPVACGGRPLTISCQKKVDDLIAICHTHELPSVRIRELATLKDCQRFRNGTQLYFIYLLLCFYLATPTIQKLLMRSVMLSLMMAVVLYINLVPIDNPAYNPEETINPIQTIQGTGWEPNCRHPGSNSC